MINAPYTHRLNLFKKSRTWRTGQDDSGMIRYEDMQRVHRNMFQPARTKIASPSKNELAEVIGIDGDFTGQIVSCIGASACPIGLLQTESAATQIADALNELLSEYPDLPPTAYESIISGIGISGCASACGLNLIAGIGFHGHKKRIDGEAVEFYQLHLSGQINETQHTLAVTNAQWLVKADEVGSVVSALVRPYLEQIRKTDDDKTLKDFMASKRPLLQNEIDSDLSNIIEYIKD
ncbi:hypothetical protein [Pontiella agarivorans]|uniref:Nitrite/sulphite reductase 4Fe-4S domain-containing protein n=1 Tax=Pontiella agarivorans TaxID=3038953 RepID=A0ABU5MZW8_9BACT|nr:hypothetical protein [Pontiella agarivorans]MDZ8119703.1 hypothetical protein [Pontiella agarivorans]